MTDSNNQFIQKLIEVIEANLSNEQFGVSELAKILNIDRTALYRKVKTKTGKSTSTFLREIRLNKAYDLLKSESGNVSEIGSEVGFSSVTYFIKCFHDFFGYSPGEIIKNDLELPSKKPTQKILSNKNIKKKRVVISFFFTFLAVAILAFYSLQTSSKKSIEKSIVVLPFINDTPNNDNYYMEGLREEIINKLALIKEIKIISRTSSDTYRNSNKPINRIAKELRVNYVLEGSSQTIDGKTRIRLQLIEANSDDHLWSKPFEREINDENIFDVQQEIAELVCKNLKANISSNEKEMISKYDTKDKTAYSYYLQGINYYNIYLKERKNNQLQKAKSLFTKAIQHDTIYSKAILQLAWTLYQESKSDYTKTKRDSAILLVNKAININPLLSEAYSFKGFLCQRDTKEATKAFKMAIRTGPDKPEGYHQFGNYCCNIGEYANTIKYSLKALEVNNDPIDHDWTLINLNVAFALTGYFDFATKYRNEYMVQHNNQMIYFNMQQFEALMKRNYAESISYGLLALQSDSTDRTTLDFLANAYLLQKKFKKALHYYKMYFEYLRLQPYQIDFPTEYDFLYSNNRHSNSLGNEILPLLHTTYLYGLGNKKTIYENHKKALLDNLEKHAEYNSLWYQSNLCFLELGCLYASLNETEKAIKNLRKLTKGKVNPIWLVNYLKDSPMLDSLRSNTDFTEILNAVETNYQKERQKAKTILIENGFDLD